MKAFVKIGYGQTFASLNFNVVFGVFSLAALYQIPELTTALLESKTNSVVQNQIPLQDLPDYLTLAHKNHCTLEPLLTVMVDKTLKGIPDRARIMKVPLDLDFLKGQLGRILPAGTDLVALLESYKKFLVLKVCFNLLLN